MLRQSLFFFPATLITSLTSPSASSFLLSSQLEYSDYEDHHDGHVSQMLVPRSHQEDATLILNNLLKEYDKTLRPDIGGKAGSCQ